MPTTKPTEKGQDERKDHLRNLRQRRAKIARLSSLKSTPEWMDYKSVIEDFIEVEKRRYEFTVQSARNHFDRENRPILAEHVVTDLNCSKAIQESYEVALSIVENTDERLAQIDLEIKKYERAFKEAAEILR